MFLGVQLPPNKVLGSLGIGSMSGIFTYIYHKNQPSVGNYAMHWILWSYGFFICTNKSQPRLECEASKFFFW